MDRAQYLAQPEPVLHRQHKLRDQIARMGPDQPKALQARGGAAHGSDHLVGGDADRLALMLDLDPLFPITHAAVQRCVTGQNLDPVAFQRSLDQADTFSSSRIMIRGPFRSG